MDNSKWNIAMLTLCQAMLFAISATVVSVSSLAGHDLASDTHLASLPVTAWMLGAALTTLPFSLYMQRSGRRAGFLVGSCCGLAGVVVSALAIHTADFCLLCAGTMLLGVGNGAGQYYRFAAAETVPAGSVSTAVSLVLTGGLIGGLLGPHLSRYTIALFPQRYLGCYLSLALYAVVTLLALARFRPDPATAASLPRIGRNWSNVIRQPFILATILSTALVSGVMVLLMVATPLAMSLCRHSYTAASSVVGWHFIGMFAPSLVTGRLIRRFGEVRIMLLGVLILYGCVVVALSGSDVALFWGAMFLLGIGWNLVFIGGTTLLSNSVESEDKAVCQGCNDMCIALIQVVASLSSGWLISSGGWKDLNCVALACITLVLALQLYLLRGSRQRIPSLAVSAEQG